MIQKIERREKREKKREKKEKREKIERQRDKERTERERRETERETRQHKTTQDTPGHMTQQDKVQGTRPISHYTTQDKTTQAGHDTKWRKQTCKNNDNIGKSPLYIKRTLVACCQDNLTHLHLLVISQH